MGERRRPGRHLAEVVAAERDTSISALTATYLEQLIGREDNYDEVWRRERELMRAGLGIRVGTVTWTRNVYSARAAEMAGRAGREADTLEELRAEAATSVFGGLSTSTDVGLLQRYSPSAGPGLSPV